MSWLLRASRGAALGHSRFMRSVPVLQCPCRPLSVLAQAPESRRQDYVPLRPFKSVSSMNTAMSRRDVRHLATAPQSPRTPDPAQQPPAEPAAASPTDQTVPDRLWTVPNALTMIRMALAPVCGALIVQGEYQTAFGALALAGSLDVADGWIARRFNQQSVIGSYLDPLADKALLACAALTLGYTSIISPAVVFIIVGRDVLLIAGGFYVRATTKPPGVPFFSTSHTSSLKIEPTKLSKLNTLLQLALVCGALGNAAWDWGTAGGWLVDGLSAAVVATTIGSGVDYFLNHGMKAIVSPSNMQRLQQARSRLQGKSTSSSSSSTSAGGGSSGGGRKDS